MYGFRSAVAALCALSIASTASAVVLQFTGELRVDDIAFVGPIPSFSIGDTFDFTMSLEDSALTADVNPNADTGTFSDALIAFSMTRDGGNTGNWDPAPATFAQFTSAPFTGTFFTGDTFRDTFSFNLVPNANAATNTVNLGSFDFFDFELGDSTATAILDTGAGQLFSQQLAAGGGQLRLQDFDQPSATLAFNSGMISLNVTQLNQVPEPTAGMLFCLGLGAALLARRREAVYPALEHSANDH